MRIDIRYTMTAPLSHIGETASTGAYFNMIKTTSGRLPVVTGNSIRGQIRDAGPGCVRGACPEGKRSCGKYTKGEDKHDA